MKIGISCRVLPESCQIRYSRHRRRGEPDGRRVGFIRPDDTRAARRGFALCGGILATVWGKPATGCRQAASKGLRHRAAPFSIYSTVASMVRDRLVFQTADRPLRETNRSSFSAGEGSAFSACAIGSNSAPGATDSARTAVASMPISNQTRPARVGARGGTLICFDHCSLICKSIAHRAGATDTASDFLSRSSCSCWRASTPFLL